MVGGMGLILSPGPTLQGGFGTGLFLTQVLSFEGLVHMALSRALLICGAFSNLDAEGNQQKIVPEERETPSDESEKEFITTAFQIRAAVATAIGATAARAKLLADHEERETELLMETIIEAERMMEQDNDLLQQQKKYLVREWVKLLRQAFYIGVPRWKDNAVLKPLIISTP